jgi:hypothetical protein
MTSPGSGARVSGAISVSANAFDNVGIAGVQFKLDGANLAAEERSAPYAISWNTASASNGSHTLSAVARDAAGNRGTASVTVTVFNDTVRPAVTMTSPSPGATVSGTVSVSANASDNTGVAGVQFVLDGANLAVEERSAPYEISWDTTTAPNGTHTLSAVARDASGNRSTSAGVTVTVSNGGGAGGGGGGATVTRLEEDNPAISFTQGWVRHGPEVAVFSGGAAASSDIAGASARLTFTGTAVTWIGLKCNICGIATVSIDGGAATPVNTAGPAAVPSAGLTSEPVFTVSGLAAGVTHTLVITVTGTTSSNRAHIVIDAFDLTDGAGTAGTGTGTGGAPTSHFEENNPAIIASPADAWVQHGAEVAAFSGGSAATSNVPGATVTLPFTGTGVRWVGLKCDICGIATVSIDGGPATSVDTAGPAAVPSAGLASETVFTASGLAAGAHTLVITVKGTTSSNGAHIVIDAFDVTAGDAAATGGAGTTRIDDTSPAVSYIGNWVHGTDPRASGGTFAEVQIAGSSANVSFTGTGVRWLGFLNVNNGIARVSVDGVFKSDVDTYAASPGSATVFISDALPRGAHTLTIEVTGRKNPASTDSWVIIDAFDVTP